MTRKLRVAIIGAGGIAHLHMPGWLASPHAEVVAVCDVNATVLDGWRERYGIAHLTTDAEELFADASIDIIDVCNPNRFHAATTIAALSAGKHVLCEKPLAPTPDEIREMIAARDRNNRLLMTAQHFRFTGTARALKAEIDTGALGAVYHARSWMLRRAALPTRPGFVIKAQSGGGACIDIGVHILDLTLWMMGHPRPVSVTGVARTELAKQPGAFGIWGDIPPQMEVEEFAAAFVRFDNGATLILEVSWMLHHNAPDVEDMQMWLYGQAGGAHWPACTLYQSHNPTRQHYNRSLQLLEDSSPPHALECMTFAQAVAEGRPSPVPAEESLMVQTILDGIYRSYEQGGEVRL